MAKKTEIYIGAAVLVMTSHEAVVDAHVAGNNGLDKVRVMDGMTEKLAVIPNGMVNPTQYNNTCSEMESELETMKNKGLTTDTVKAGNSISWFQTEFATVVNDLVNNYGGTVVHETLLKKKPKEEENGAIFDWSKIPLGNEFELFVMHYAFLSAIEEIVDGKTVEDLQLYDQGQLKTSSTGFREFLKALVSVKWDVSKLDQKQLDAIASIVTYLNEDTYTPDQPIIVGGVTLDEIKAEIEGT